MFGSESGVVEHSIIHAKSPIMCLPLNPAILGNVFKNCGRVSSLASHLKDKPVLHICSEVAARGLGCFCWKWGPLRVDSEQGDICSAADLGESKRVDLHSLNGLFLPKIHIHIYILEWQGHRNQQKVIHTPRVFIPCGNPPRWWNGVLMPNIPSQLKQAGKPDGKALTSIRKISVHSGITFLFSCSGVPQRTLHWSSSECSFTTGFFTWKTTQY